MKQEKGAVRAEYHRSIGNMRGSLADAGNLAPPVCQHDPFSWVGPIEDPRMLDTFPKGPRTRAIMLVVFGP